MWPAWQMTWLLAYSGLPLKDCTWCWAELCKIYSLRHLLTPSRTLTFPRLHPGNWVRRCFIAYIWQKHFLFSSKWWSFCICLCRYQANRRYWQQVAGNLCRGGGAKLSCLWRGQHPAQWQDCLYMWEVHPGNDAGGCRESVWECAAQSPIQSHEVRLENN